MSYVLDDGRSIVMSSNPIRMKNGIADVDTDATNDDMTYVQADLAWGPDRETLTVGECYWRSGDSRFTTVTAIDVPPINAGQMAPLSADVSAFGFGLRTMGVCDGGD